MALQSWCYHHPIFRMRNLRPYEGTRLARVTEPSQTEPKAWVGLGGLTRRGPLTLSRFPLPRVTLFAAGMSEDGAAQAPRHSSWEQDQQVRGQVWHGAWRGGGQSFPGRPRAGTRPPPLALRAFWTAEGADIAAPPTRFPEGHMRPREGSDSPSTPGRLTWPLPTLFLCQPSWPLNDEHNGCNHSISASAAVPRASQTWETRVPIAALETPLTDGETEARSHSPTRPSSHSAEAA